MRPLHRIALIGAVCAVLAAVGVGAWAFGRDAAEPRPPGEVVVGESPSAEPGSPGPDGGEGGDNGVVDPPPAVTGSAEPTPSPSSSPPPDPGTGGGTGGAPGGTGDDDDDDDDDDDLDDDD